MVQDDPLKWETEPAENFLNEHLLYRGIHKNLWSKWSDIQDINPNFFMTQHAPPGLSVDWSKYATPQETLTNHLKSNLYIFGIVELNVGEFRFCVKENEFPLTIQHDPNKEESEIEPLNRAHTLIKGFTRTNTSKIRMILSRIAIWAPEMKPIIE